MQAEQTIYSCVLLTPHNKLNIHALTRLSWLALQTSVSHVPQVNSRARGHQIEKWGCGSLFFPCKMAAQEDLESLAIDEDEISSWQETMVRLHVNTLAVHLPCIW